jgi:hypothetical protein
VFQLVYRPWIEPAAMSAPPKILELIDLYRRNADAYHAPQYNEAMVRQEFINPLFKCLGRVVDASSRAES